MIKEDTCHNRSAVQARIYTLLAGIILPVSTLFELKDIQADIFSGQWNKVIYEDQAIEAIGEAKGDYEAVCEIAKKLEKYGGEYEGLYEKFTEGRTIDEDIKSGYEHAEVPMDEYPFEKLLEQQYFAFPTRRTGKMIQLVFQNSPKIRKTTRCALLLAS